MPEENVTTTEAPPAAPEVKADATPEAKPDIHIPKARFDEVSKRAQAFERYGTPEQVAEAYQQLAYYREIERQALEEASKSKSGEPTDETAKRLAEAREVLYTQVDPELKDSKEQAKVAHAYTQAQQDRCRRIATRETKAILKEAGLDDSDVAVVRMGKQLASYFDDPELNDEFWFNPRAAVRQAHKAWREDISKGIPKDKAAEPTPETRLPRGPTPTGGSPNAGKPGADTAAMSEKDFEAHIKAKMRAGLGH